MIATVQQTLALGKGDPSTPEAVEKTKEELTKWVAKYRRDVQFGGRASYG